MAADVGSTTGGGEATLETEEARTDAGGPRDLQDRADMELIAAGEFWMGSSLDAAVSVVEECKGLGVAQTACATLVERELPRHRVVLDAYLVDRYEVTNGQFERFVTATGHVTTAEREGRGWVVRLADGAWQWNGVARASWRSPDGARSAPADDHPVVQVSWDDAVAYCGWAGKRLPTEAEWEKAARGSDGRAYPWGAAWDESKAHNGAAIQSTGAVGAHPDGAGPYQVHDMAGNAAEWVADWFDRQYYERSPESNPTGPASGQYRVVRGGSWGHSHIYLRTAHRGRETPESHDNRLGFRCGLAAP